MTESTSTVYIWKRANLDVTSYNYSNIKFTMPSIEYTCSSEAHITFATSIRRKVEPLLLLVHEGFLHAILANFNVASSGVLHTVGRPYFIVIMIVLQQ